MSSEDKYLDLLNDVLTRAILRKTRNGTTYGIFAPRLDFDLKEGFPLLTTKKMFTRGIIEELLWFLRGETDNAKLKELGVHIWDGNTTRQFLDSRGLHNYKEDECGPIYGFQWRRFNCEYPGANVSINEVPMVNKNQDQFAEVIRQINEDPMSRRIIMCGWNPCQMDQMCLPPCHVLYQFYVRIDDNGKKHLSLHMFQRSADLFLGVPFNIASCAFLVHIVANITGCEVDKLVISMTDAHIYEEHIGACSTQVSRREQKFPFPKLNINKKISLDNLGEISAKDFIIEGYQCQPAIKAPMIA